TSRRKAASRPPIRIAPSQRRWLSGVHVGLQTTGRLLNPACTPSCTALSTRLPPRVDSLGHGRPRRVIRRFSIPRRKPLKQLGELVEVQRFDQVRIEPSLPRTPAVRVLPPTGQCDERNSAAPGLGADPPRNLVAIELRHADIQQRHFG